MATTYTPNAQLGKPATSDRNWDATLNANADALDALTALGALATTATEVPSASLQVRVAPGQFRKADGTVGSFAGASSVAVAASSTTYLWLDNTGALDSGSAFPTTAHVQLAQVVAGPSTIARVVDQRIQCSMAGTGQGFLLATGGSLTGAFAVDSPTTGSAVFSVDPVNNLVGFFGVAPASQPAAIASLSAPAGTASNGLSDAGTSFSQAVLNNNFASLAAKVDALIAALQRLGLIA